MEQYTAPRLHEHRALLLLLLLLLLLYGEREWWVEVYLECAVFLSFHHVQYDGGDHVEALTVAHLVVPACVRKQYAL